MLEKYSKIINLVNYSNIGDKRICQFYANINSDDPVNMDMGRHHRERCVQGKPRPGHERSGRI